MAGIQEVEEVLLCHQNCHISVFNSKSDEQYSSKPAHRRAINTDHSTMSENYRESAWGEVGTENEPLQMVHFSRLADFNVDL